MQAAKLSFKPAPLRLDDQGREIDEFGNAVKKPAESVTTLKVSPELPRCGLFTLLVSIW